MRAKPSESRALANPLYHLVLFTLDVTYRKHPHAFTHGCSRTTMASWVYIATGVRLKPQLIRDVLEQAVRHGKINKGVSQCGYTTFTSNKAAK